MTICILVSSVGELFQAAVHHLSGQTLLPNYHVQRTARLRLWQLVAEGGTPATLVPVNLILVTTEHVCRTREAFAELITSSFDITLCCVRLQMSADLTFVLTEYLEAFRALEEQKLVLTSRAFSSKRNALQIEMDRIFKYLRRGFRW